MFGFILVVIIMLLFGLSVLWISLVVYCMGFGLLLRMLFGEW